MSRRPRGTLTAIIAPVVAVSIVGLLAALLAGCGATSSALPVQRTPSPTARLDPGGPARIAVIVMENEEYGDIIGSSSTPYINGLARRYALGTGMYAISHLPGAGRQSAAARTWWRSAGWRPTRTCSGCPGCEAPRVPARRRCNHCWPRDSGAHELGYRRDGERII